MTQLRRDRRAGRKSLRGARLANRTAGPHARLPRTTHRAIGVRPVDNDEAARAAGSKHWRGRPRPSPLLRQVQRDLPERDPRRSDGRFAELDALVGRLIARGWIERSWVPTEQVRRSGLYASRELEALGRYGIAADKPIDALVCIRCWVWLAAREALQLARGVHLAVDQEDADKEKSMKKLRKLIQSLDDLEHFPTELAPAVTVSDDSALLCSDVLSVAQEASRVARQRLIDLHDMLAAERRQFRRSARGQLAYLFILYMGIIWFLSTGREPAKSERGPFVDFVSAGWHAAGFPNPTRRKPRGSPAPAQARWLGKLIAKTSKHWPGARPKKKFLSGDIPEPPD